jgi:hypothetical protein
VIFAGSAGVIGRFGRQGLVVQYGCPVHAVVPALSILITFMRCDQDSCFEQRAFT